MRLWKVDFFSMTAMTNPTDDETPNRMGWGNLSGSMTEGGPFRPDKGRFL